MIEFKELCQCKKNTAVYICMSEQCPDKANKFYCSECCIELEKHNTHKHINIKKELG
jgi:hypothetical protein